MLNYTKLYIKLHYLVLYHTVLCSIPSSQLKPSKAIDRAGFLQTGPAGSLTGTDCNDLHVHPPDSTV